MKKAFVLCALCAAVASAQSLSVGVLAGAPFTNVVNATTANNITFVPQSTSFIIGPALQINLPLSLRFEVDAFIGPTVFQPAT